MGSDDYYAEMSDLTDRVDTDDTEADPQLRRRKRTRWIIGINLVYLLFLGLLTFTNVIGPEKWWFGSFNLYLPQWIWVIPEVAILLLTLLLALRLIWLPLLGLLWILGPLMGFEWHPVSHTEEEGIHLRVMTYNAKWGYRSLGTVIANIKKYHPDLLQTQDSGNRSLTGALNTLLADWTVRTYGQYSIASRYPLSTIIGSADVIPGLQTHCVKAILTVQGVPITLYDVHLLSPREGLKAVRDKQPTGMAENADERLAEAEAIAGIVMQERGPLILTGDLNSPVQSLACRPFFKIDMRDAFSQAGRGYGYTYGQSTRIHRPYVRIDHILVNSPWKVLDCWVGNQQGSDHSPVIADLFLPTKR